MRSLKLYFICAVLILGLCTCNKQPASLEEYMKWLETPGSGLTQAREVNGFRIKVKCIPPEYLAYKDMQDDHLTYSSKDSLISIYKKNLYFLFTIGPDDKKRTKDVMNDEITSYEEYAERSLSMNFDMESYVTLHMNGNTYSPVLSSMENTYGLGSSRSILFVFAPGEQEKDKGSEIDFEYRDELFGTGILHFIYSNSSINNIPAITFWNK
jgi:hypothetical protein